jgi:hypothetical protein
MKKVMIFGTFALLALASCKKDYTCTCTTTAGGVSASESVTLNATKSDAEEACNEGDATATVLGITTTTECEIQ